ncbi:Uu.00g112570.m01.CDS01 [Anthostomella pinea]|uniref:Uu.00g112570.m01.CDS01 n=1 Tax=Anthostomella pinea TaxID=933095 RepID=A0AAI8VF81_9PEZI|nr:Uu.00g112570.m01.CDS01 [Anthostomella pinea]
MAQQDLRATDSIHIRARQQPTTTPTAIPLTTTFIPPDSCNGGQLTMLPSPGYEIWLNEPVPVPSSTFSGCYPSEFLQDYETYRVNTKEVGSRVPMMKPLVCPFGWHVVSATGSYQACCPTEYLLAPPSTPVDANRPAYGGTCYSDWTLGQFASVSGYGPSSFTGMVLASATVTPFQVYAHVIDGIAVPTESTSPSNGETSGSTTVNSGSSTLPTGAIAGIVVAAVVIVLVSSVVAFLLRRRRRRRRLAPTPPPPPPKENGDGVFINSPAIATPSYPSEMDSKRDPSEMESKESKHNPYEMHARPNPPELDAERDPSEMAAKEPARSIYEMEDGSVGWSIARAQPRVQQSPGWL